MSNESIKITPTRLFFVLHELLPVDVVLCLCVIVCLEGEN